MSSSSPHGTRARYVAGCHCLPCTAANRAWVAVAVVLVVVVLGLAAWLWSGAADRERRQGWEANRDARYQLCMASGTSAGLAPEQLLNRCLPILDERAP